MAFNPENVRGRTFIQRFRGYDPDEVDAYVAHIADQLDELRRQHDALKEQVGKGGSDLKAELAAASADVARVLEAAREAAESIRLRASADAASWRAEALSETEETKTTAEAQSIALRKAAWEASTDMLVQSEAAAFKLDEEARRQSLDILGEAERDAHRVSAEARRNADEVLRSARLESERTTLEARGRANEIIEEARKQAEASQERARALEVRRSELLEELESVRTTISELEERIETRQEEVRVAEEQEWRDSSTVKVLAAPGEWPEGESVRVVPQEISYPLTQPVDASELADEVRRLREESGPEVAEDEPELDLEPEPPAEANGSAEEVQDDGVGGLFEALRGPGDVDESASLEPASTAEVAGVATAEPADTNGASSVLEAPAPSEIGEPDTDHQTEPAGDLGVQEDESAAAAEDEDSEDPFALREQLLLPIVNQALRELKRTLTDEQNVALEQLRTTDDWMPDGDELPDKISRGFEQVATASYEAGTVAAEQLTGSKVVAPVAEAGELSDHVAPFVEALLEAVRDAVDGGRGEDQGPRELAASVSRVFRSWRTEQAEQRLHFAAHEAYHRGLVAALISAGVTQLRWMAAAPKTKDCRAAERAERREPGEAFVGTHDVPPVDLGCTCTLVPA